MQGLCGGARNIAERGGEQGKRGGRNGGEGAGKGWGRGEAIPDAACMMGLRSVAPIWCIRSGKA